MRSCSANICTTEKSVHFLRTKVKLVTWGRESLRELFVVAVVTRNTVRGSLNIGEAAIRLRPCGSYDVLLL